MSGAPHRLRATFWLIDADDSLAVQSRREPDGTGLAWFDADGHPRVDKQPVAAYQDRAFAREAREVESETFVAHIRYASTGGMLAQNTHPFQQHGRAFAHTCLWRAAARTPRSGGGPPAQRYARRPPSPVSTPASGPQNAAA